MKQMTTLGWIAFILVIIGGLNWGLIGAFGVDVLGMILGGMEGILRIVYVLVGLSALYMLFTGMKSSKM